MLFDCLQSVTMNRKVMTPFDFSDGTHVPAGNTVCVPQQAMMQDPELYSNALEFQGFRFVTQRDGAVTSTSRLSHPSLQFPFWGSVGHAWCVLPMQSLSSYVKHSLTIKTVQQDFMYPWLPR